MNRELYFINFHEPPKIEGHYYFTTEGMLKIITFAVLSMLLIVLLQFLYKSFIASSLNSLKIEHENITKKIEKAKETKSTFKVDEELKDEVKDLEDLVNQKKLLVGHIDDIMITNRQGFSRFLLAISKRWEQGMWLSKLKFLTGGSDLEMSGYTLGADIVTEFLKKIGREEVFSGMNFQFMSINDSKDKLEFFITTIKGNTKFDNNEKIGNGK